MWWLEIKEGPDEDVDRSWVYRKRTSNRIINTEAEICGRGIGLELRRSELNERTSEEPNWGLWNKYNQMERRKNFLGDRRQTEWILC